MTQTIARTLLGLSSVPVFSYDPVANETHPEGDKHALMRQSKGTVMSSGKVYVRLLKDKLQRNSPVRRTIKNGEGFFLANPHMSTVSYYTIG